MQNEIFIIKPVFEKETPFGSAGKKFQKFSRQQTDSKLSRQQASSKGGGIPPEQTTAHKKQKRQIEIAGSNINIIFSVLKNFFKFPGAFRFRMKNILYCTLKEEEN